MNCISKYDDVVRRWASMPAPERGEIIRRAGRLMEVCKDEIVETIMHETFKTVEEAEGEYQSAVDMAYFMAGEGRRSLGETMPSALEDRLAMTKRYPIGVVGVITPWNFPFSLVAWKVLPALVCGNAVILKPSSKTQKSADLFAAIMKQAGLPDGVLTLAYGNGDVGMEVIRNVDMVSFTGSTQVGMKIAEVCGRNLKKCSLELGGKNAVIVMEDADIDMAVDAVIKGAFSFAGQRCTATSRVIVMEPIYGRFIGRLIREMRKLKIRKVISLKQAEMIKDYIASGKREARLLAGGRVRGLLVEPTVFTDVQPLMEIESHEIFGPVLCVMTAKSIDEAIDMHNTSLYGLSVSVFTNDINVAMRMIDSLEAGVCYINAPTFGSEVHMPFGGVKWSGNGHREVGKAAVEAFSELKTIYIDYSGRCQNAQYKK